MSQPLAIVFYERLMPGSQLVNRLQDSNYRVLVLNNAARLAAAAVREMPLLLIIDLDAPGDVLGAIAKIKSTPGTAHLPIIAFAPEHKPELLAAARKAGVSQAVSEIGLGNHLPQLLDQALQVD